MIDVGTVISYGLKYLQAESMDDGIQIENPEEITHSLLHDLKNMVVDIQNLKADNLLMEDRFKMMCNQQDSLLSQNEHIRSMLDDVLDAQMHKIKIPHRCPVCNGSTLDEEGALCHPCDGRGIVWG